MKSALNNHTMAVDPTGDHQAGGYQPASDQLAHTRRCNELRDTAAKVAGAYACGFPGIIIAIDPGDVASVLRSIREVYFIQATAVSYVRGEHVIKITW